MEKLGSLILSQIYQKLTLTDTLRASRTCRKWCFMLWREEEQFNIWFHFVLEKLWSIDYALQSCQSKVLANAYHHRQLPYKTPEAIMYFINVIMKDKVNKEMNILARSVTLIPHVRYLILQPPYSTARFNVKHKKRLRNIFGNSFDCPPYFAPCFSSEKVCAVYRYSETNDDEFNLYCLQGMFSANKDLIDGAIIRGGEIIYEGQFYASRPNGRGVLYHKGKVHVRGNFVNGEPHGFATFFVDGFLKYEGEYVHSKQHGQGVEYYDLMPHVKKFEGMWNAGESEQGIWYNTDGSILHFGNVMWFKEQLKLCNEQHRCTYSFTKNCHVKQVWWHCETCFGSTDMLGVCLACAENCHKGHKLTIKKISQFYCDCGNGDAPFKCKAMNGCPEHCDCTRINELALCEDDNNSNEVAENENQLDQNGDHQVEPIIVDEPIVDENAITAAANQFHRLMIGQIPPEVQENPNLRIVVEIGLNDFRVLGFKLTDDIDENDEHDNNLNNDDAHDNNANDD